MMKTWVGCWGAWTSVLAMAVCRALRLYDCLRTRAVIDSSVGRVLSGFEGDQGRT